MVILVLVVFQVSVVYLVTLAILDNQDFPVGPASPVLVVYQVTLDSPAFLVSLAIQVSLVNPGSPGSQV